MPVYDRDIFRLIGFIGAALLWSFKRKNNFIKFVRTKSGETTSITIGFLIIFIVIFLINKFL